MHIGKKLLLTVTLSVVLITALCFCAKLLVHPGLKATFPQQLQSAPTHKLNINTATADQLSELPGIGPNLADAIVSYREKHGSFQKIGDLILVEGIGKGRLEAIADQITTGG